MTAGAVALVSYLGQYFPSLASERAFFSLLSISHSSLPASHWNSALGICRAAASHLEEFSAADRIGSCREIT